MPILSKILNSQSKMKQIILLFLLGFFLGAALHYLFQKSYTELLQQMDASAANWASKESSFLRLFIYTLYEHGKYFLLLWLLSSTKLSVFGMIAFTLYRGFGLGFLFAFFINLHGAKGLMFFFGSMFPHVLLLLPMYLFLFAFIYRGKKEKQGIVLFMLSIVLTMACFMEVYFNVPLMKELYLGTWVGV
jgi:hypothetical protein